MLQFRRLRAPSSSFNDNYARGRLNNFPTDQGQTQTILYPGSSGALPQYDYEEPAAPVFSLPLPTPTTTTTTSTTPYPVMFEERRPAASRLPIAPVVPVASIRTPANRRRPQSNNVGNRFQDIIDEIEPLTEKEEERRFREEQARNAHYTFGTSIDDGINDQSIHRQETRNGLALKGMYSYSDGFFRRTIHYEADEKGYRVVK